MVIEANILNLVFVYILLTGKTNMKICGCKKNKSYTAILIKLQTWKYVAVKGINYILRS